VRALIVNLFQAYGVDSGSVAFNLSADEVFLNLDTAIPCALIINELVSNALKHAFPGGRKGALSINLRGAGDNRWALEVVDDGAGRPAVAVFWTATGSGPDRPTGRQTRVAQRPGYCCCHHL
jgi:two-component sensor histidine kinase